jgi:hypothetical protein
MKIETKLSGRAYKEFCDLNQDRIIDTDNKFGEAIQVRLKAIDE